MRRSVIDLRGDQKRVGRQQGYSTHLRSVTWHEVALLTITLSATAYFLGEPDRSGKSRVGQWEVEHSGPIRSIVFRPDGGMLLSVGVDGFAMLWQLEGGQKSPFPVATHEQVRCAVFSADNSALVTLDQTGAVTVHDLVTQSSRLLYQPPSVLERAICLAFAPDNNTLAIGHHDGRIGLWDIGTGQNRQVLRTNSSFIVSLAFSPVSATLVFASGDRSVRLVDLANGQNKFLCRDQMSTASVLSFSPDGQFLIMGNHVSPTIRRWDLQAGREQIPLQGLQGNLMTVTINNDASTLAAAGFDGVVRFWDLQTLRIASRQLRNARVYSVAFAPDGRTLATGDLDGSIQFWDWPECTPTDPPRLVAASRLSVNLARGIVADAHAGTRAAKRPAASVQAAVSRGS